MTRNAISKAVLASGILLLFPLSACISPETPVPIVMGGSVSQGTNVAGNGSGFVAGWRTNMNLAATSFSSNQGQTWSSPATFGSNVISLVSLSAQSSKFLAAWITNVRNVSASVSSNGLSWSAPVVIASDGGGETIQTFVTTAATNAGFMAIWTSDLLSVGIYVKTSFSADGVNWNAPVSIPTAFFPTANKISIAGNANGFLAGFTDDTIDQGYVSFSSDNGMTWGTPVLVAPTLGNNCTLGLGANASGFMAAWVDSSGKIATSFSSDNGATWSSPVQIQMSIAFSGSVPRVSANSGSFVVAWTQGFSLEAQASCTQNQGITWSNPYIFESILNAPIFDVSVFGSRAMFTWHDTANNPISTYSPISGGGGDGADSTLPSDFFRQITPNRPGKTVFN